MAGSVAGGRDFRAKLASAWAGSGSMLCVGLDPDPARFPAHLRGRPRAVLEFCTAIADATAPFVCAFKPQIAYFASLGAEEQLSAVMDHLRTHHPRIPVILDAKRGDIGSTAEHYAREVFERYAADAVTVSPYLGGDAIAPFLAYPGRGVLVLCRTSNPGGADLQSLPVHAPVPAHLPVPAHPPVQAHPEPEADGAELSSMGVAGEPMPLYAYVAQLAATCWNAEGQIGLVVGATYPQELRRVRQLAPDLPLLVPGIGAQGGDIDAVVAAGLDPSGAGLMISSSRAILYAGEGEDYAHAAARVAQHSAESIRRAVHRETAIRQTPQVHAREGITARGFSSYTPRSR